MDLDDAAKDREAKIVVAELSAKTERDSLFLEERARIGAQVADASAQAFDHQHKLNVARMQAMIQQSPTARTGWGRRLRINCVTR